MRTIPLPAWKKIALVAALKLSNGSPTKAAKMIGVSRATMYRWMKKYGMERDR